MGRSAKTGDGASAEPESLGPAIAAAAEVVRRDGAIARTALVRLGIPKKRLDEAVEALAREGLEVTAKSVRVPVREQLLSLLATGSALTTKSAAGTVSGATKAEITKAVAALVDAGDARLVLRTKELVLVGTRADVVAGPELEAIERALRSLLEATKRARKKRAALLRADVEQTMSRFVTPRHREAGTNGAATQAAASDAGTRATSSQDIAQLVDQHRDASGLTFVPTLVRAFGGEGARDAVHAELLRGARSGIFELRPESGLGRLSAEDLDLCIPGPQGSRLSWVRRVQP
jgi:hypothetical protein